MEAITTPHNITLGYTNADDGIHVSCSCGWEKVLDTDPSVDAVNLASSEHLLAVNKEGTPDCGFPDIHRAASALHVFERRNAMLYAIRKLGTADGWCEQKIIAAQAYAMTIEAERLGAALVKASMDRPILYRPVEFAADVTSGFVSIAQAKRDLGGDNYASAKASL